MASATMRAQLELEEAVGEIFGKWVLEGGNASRYSKRTGSVQLRHVVLHMGQRAVYASVCFSTCANLGLPSSNTVLSSGGPLPEVFA